MQAQFTGAGHDDVTVFVFEGDAVREAEIEVAFGAFDDDSATVECASVRPCECASMLEGGERASMRACVRSFLGV